MPISRIYQNIPLKTGQDVQLSDGAFHHLARVLRAKAGELVVIFNGQGGEYKGVIATITKKNIVVTIHHEIEREAESSLNIILAQGISRGEKMDYTIQKAVELGVKKIIPLITERCTVKLNQERSERRWQHWQSIIIGACEQSGRNYIPELSLPQFFENWVTAAKADFCFVLAPNSNNHLKEIVIPNRSHVILAIGPEGGWTEKEEQIAKNKDFMGLNLGPRILRTETAAIAALTAFQCLYGDM